MSDSDLVKGLRERDPAAFQRACDHYLPSIWRYVYTRVNGDQHLAEDIVSETLLALVKTVNSSKPGAEIENPGGWLRTVAGNKVQDHFRAAARVRHLIDNARQNSTAADDQSDPAKQHDRQERRAEVRRAMDQLSDQHRTALEWKYLEKRSVREIAERWQMTEKAAESILFRARRELRRCLDKQDEPERANRSQNGNPPADAEQSQVTPQKDSVM